MTFDSVQLPRVRLIALPLGPDLCFEMALFKLRGLVAPFPRTLRPGPVGGYFLQLRGESPASFAALEIESSLLHKVDPTPKLREFDFALRQGFAADRALDTELVFSGAAGADLFPYAKDLGEMDYAMGRFSAESQMNLAFWSIARGK